MMSLRDKLVHAATRYDERQKNRKPRKPNMGNGYNHYALGQYFGRIDEVMADIERGAIPREAIVAGFCGPLRQAMLKAGGFPPDRSDDGPWHYEPVKPR